MVAGWTCPLVTADVRRLHLIPSSSEPPHVGCYEGGGRIAATPDEGDRAEP
jgi:hypothetical protein